MSNLPKYTINKKNGNIAEALIQTELSKFCLVHKIDGSNDIGNDFICELIRDKSPTNLLFYIQVKFTSTEKKPNIRQETKDYWKGSPIPVFVFWVKETQPIGLRSLVYEPTTKIFYKRFTPIVHGKTNIRKEKYKEYERRLFMSDLIIDYMRTQYIKGFTPMLDVRDYLGLDDKLFTVLPRYFLPTKDVILEYRDQIKSKSWTTIFSLAKILSIEDNKESLELALGFIEKAILLYEKYTEDDEYNFSFVNMMVSCKSDISNKIRHL